jgi:ribosomal protein L40E
MRLPRRIFGPSCPCGARLSMGDIFCRKCRARARWLRRKSRYPDL